VTLVSGTHLKPHGRFLIGNYHVYQIRHPGLKGGNEITIKKRCPTPPCRSPPPPPFR
jgi:hypothetical protein